MNRILPIAWLLSATCWWSGCQTRPAATTKHLEADGIAARARFEAVQAQHRETKTPATFERLPFTRPERTEDGIIYTASTEFIRLLIQP